MSKRFQLSRTGKRRIEHAIACGFKPGLGIGPREFIRERTKRRKGAK